MIRITLPFHLCTLAGVSGELSFDVAEPMTIDAALTAVEDRYPMLRGTIRDHTLVYTVIIAGGLTVFFDLSRIASLGAFFYLVMDMLIHWGVFRNQRKTIAARGWVMLTAIGLDALVLGAFALLKWQTDRPIVFIALAGILSVFAFERIFLAARQSRSAHHHESNEGG